MKSDEEVRKNEARKCWKSREIEFIGKISKKNYREKQNIHLISY